MSTSTTSPSCAAVRIIPVTSVDEIPALAHMCDLSLQSDPLYAFLSKHGEYSSVYQEQVEKITAAVLDTECSKVFKAVKPMRNNEGVIEGVIVGLSQWYVGYCNVPKVDPFAAKENGGNGEAVEVITDQQPAGSFFKTPDVAGIPLPVDTPSSSSPATTVSAQKDFRADLMRRSGNSYISTIRGKKHVYLRRMMVHPDYQRQGIGQKLMQWGLDTADEQKIVGWLFSRPAGRKLYEKAGYKVVEIIEIEWEGAEVPATASMLRLPKERDVRP